ncbi:Gfo/Idh/MocA family protein [Rhizobium etli]|uniref:Gfo/Idh/MocA family protein n=1 Tax=Rhizobium etli TaxID=29449 RepID=UPI000383A097|nr:Gfo/Idh/MocA family oxidoreductase [Rhizobium etli]AGS26514.1 glucose-fructose oxidoreductase protein [Rhizobium etli bv. mimosae str. Mim1]
MLTPIRYAVVGAGWISQEAFLPAVPQTGNSRVTAIISGNREGATQLAAFFAIDHVCDYRDFDALLRQDVVDAVYIAVPNPMHHDFAVRAANAGKHVMVEKPIATSEKEAIAMIDAAARNDVLLMTSYRLHNEPATLTALDILRARKIGEPLAFSASFGFQSQTGNHRLKSEFWGGPLQDIGIYCINAARHVFEAEPVEVFAMAARPQNDQRFTEVDASIAVTLRFPQNRLAQFFCSFGVFDVDTYRIAGTEGELIVENGFRFDTPSRLIVKTKRNIDNISYGIHDQFAGQIQYFSQCILTGTRPEPDGEEGLADLKVLIAIEQSMRAGAPQPVSNPTRPGHPDLSMVRRLPTTTRRLLL